jgi:membrane protein YdbS with pleckstrin-like domain
MAELGINKNHISVTHVNVRVSIVFLLLKLVLLDIIAAVFVIFFFGALSSASIPTEVRLFVFSQNIIYFTLLAVVKVALTIYLVVQWLNEYYEITPTNIHYRRGIIWRREDVFELKNVRTVGIQQGILGRFFSFGTLSFYDRAVYKYYYLSDIHNPSRYLSILRRIVPGAEMEREVVLESFHDKDLE